MLGLPGKVRQWRTVFLLAFGFLGFIAVPASAQSGKALPLRESALILYGHTLFPVYVAQHCDTVVARNSSVMDEAIKRWHVRQSAYFDRLAEIIDSTGGLSQQTKDLSQHMAKAATERHVEGQADKAAYCRSFVTKLDSGEFDLDKVANVSPLLNQVMAAGQ
jgi:hypothetical protein